MYACNACTEVGYQSLKAAEGKHKLKSKQSRWEARRAGGN